MKKNTKTDEASDRVCPSIELYNVIREWDRAARGKDSFGPDAGVPCRVKGGCVLLDTGKAKRRIELSTCDTKKKLLRLLVDEVCVIPGIDANIVRQFVAFAAYHNRIRLHPWGFKPPFP